MIYVWCFEQDSHSKNKFSSQDEMVPFKDINGNILSYRYYHLYVNGEIEKELALVKKELAKLTKKLEVNEPIILPNL